MSGETTIATLKVLRKGRVKEWMDFNTLATVPMVFAMGKLMANSEDDVIIEWYDADLEFTFSTNNVSNANIDIDVDVQPVDILGAPASVQVWAGVAQEVMKMEEVPLNDRLSFIWNALQKEENWKISS